MILLLAFALAISVMATGSESDTAAQNTAVDPFDEAEGDRFYSGTCGDNLTWTLNVTTGKLRISGSGAMEYYADPHDIPWYNYTSYVRELVVDDGVTSISQYAFSGCHCLNVVYIGKNITSIGNYAFTGCTNLAEVCNTSALTIPKNTDPEHNTSYGYLGYWAKSIVKSASASNILRQDGFVFWKNSYGEYELLHYEGRDTDISLPEAPIGDQSTYSISDQAFYYENQLTSVNIPNCVTKIGESAFTNCFGLTKLYIPDSVYTMSRFAVSGCSNLLWVRLGSGLTIMGGEYAGSHRTPFYSCPSILEVCNDSRFEMSANTYSQDTGITAEHIYSSESGESKFTYEDGYTIFDRDGVSTLIKYTGDNAYIFIPESIEAIEAKAFSNIPSIELVVIPSSVKSMALSSFVDCNNITQIAAPFVGKSREESARLIDIFKNSTESLESFTLTEGNGITDNALAYCHALKSVSLPSNITYIGEYAFFECTSLTEFTVPNSVTEIGENAFGHCSSLKSITLPFVGNTLDGEDNTHFGYIFGASSYLQNNTEVPTSLELVTITKATAIDEYAFYNCDDVITVTLPKKLDSIGKNAFKGCTSLFEIINLSRIPLEVGTPHESCITDNALSVLVDDFASSNIIHEDGFVFYHNISTKRFTLLRYKGNETEIVFPETIYDFTYTVDAIYSHAFENNRNITSITLPFGVKTIGESAFANCTSLKNLSMPITVEVLPYSAIAGCSSLTFNSKDGGNYLGNDSFPYLALVSVDGTDIDRVALPDTVKFILKNAFNNVTSIDTLTIPADILYIDNGAFQSSTQILNLEAPAHVIPMIPKSALVSATVNGGEDLPEKAFYQAVNLKSVALNERLAVIGDSAFFGCRSLESIDLTNIFRIDAKAFEGCSSLESVVFYHITRVSESCFKNCTSLKSVSLNDEIRLFSKDAFFGCNALSKVIVRSAIAAIIDDEYENEYANPLYYAKALYINDEKITELEIPSGELSVKPYAFVNLDITALSIPEGISVDETSFMGCESIKKLSISADYLAYIPKLAVEEIEIIAGEVIPSYSFAISHPLTKVTLGESVKTISAQAFSSCSYIKDLYILSDTVSFGNRAFYSATVENLYIPEAECWFNMTFEGDYANPISGAKLYNVYGNPIEAIGVPGDIAEVKAFTFSGCQSIKDVYIVSPDTVVDKSAFLNVPIEYLTIHASQISSFSECKPTLKKVEILSGEVLPKEAFSKASLLEYAVLCDSLKEIGDRAFAECYSLKSIIVPENVTVMGKQVFYYCSALESATLPQALTYIPEGTFLECSSLVSVNIPAGVTDIGMEAFYRCVSMQRISNAGDAITTIGENAFYDCDALTEIILPEGVIEIGANAFNHCSAVTTIYIPKSVTTFAPSAIYNCLSLKTLTCSIDHLDYPSYPELETVILNNGTTFRSSLFSSCENLSSITLPDTLEIIESSAFSNCQKITSITIPSSVTEIRANAFSGCSALESVYTESLQSWFNIYFYSTDANPLIYADNLYIGGALCTDLVIPSEITYIPENAFAGYKGLSSVTLHSDMTIGTDAFYMCDNIEKVNIPTISDWLSVYFTSEFSNPVYLSGALYVGDELLVDLVIPEGTEKINNYAFAGNTALETAYIPKSISDIGACLFSEATNLKEIICCCEEFDRFVRTRFFS